MDAHPGAVKRIVLLWLGRLGDVLVSTPVLSSVRRKYPDARIQFVTGERGAAAARLIDDVDSVRILKRFYRPAANLSLAWELAGRPCDLLIDLNTAYSRSAWFLARISRAKIKLAFSKRKGNSAYTHILEAAGEKEPMLERYGRLAAHLKAPYDPVPRIALSEEKLRAGEKILREIGATKERMPVLIFPGNFKKFDNRWPEDKFAALAETLRENQDIFPFFLAGPGEEKEVEQINARLRRPLPVLRSLPIETTAALLARTGLFVGNCTGTTHLAIAVGCPTFSFLGKYTQTVWMPKPPGKAPHFQVVSDSWESCREIGVETARAALDAALRELLKK